MKYVLTRSLVLIILLLAGCGQGRKIEKLQAEVEKIDNIYQSAYSGGYTIEVRGLGVTRDIELYVLAENGKAQWMHLRTNGGREPDVLSRKYGTWTAEKSYIKIEIDGNTGQLIEEYEMRDGVFYNKESGDRYLKRAK